MRLWRSSDDEHSRLHIPYVFEFTGELYGEADENYDRLATTYPRDKCERRWLVRLFDNGADCARWPAAEIVSA